MADEMDPFSVADDPATAGVYDFMVENMTAGEVKGLAFEIGIDPESLEGALAGELARSLIHTLAQRNELQLLSVALRDLFPADYGAKARDELE